MRAHLVAAEEGHARACPASAIDSRERLVVEHALERRASRRDRRAEPGCRSCRSRRSPDPADGDATTGHREANASATTMPKGSERDGSTNTRQARSSRPHLGAPTPAEELHAAVERELARAVLQAAAQRPVARQQQAQAGPGGRDAREGLQQDIEPLLLVVGGDAEQERIALRGCAASPVVGASSSRSTPLWIAVALCADAGEDGEAIAQERPRRRDDGLRRAGDIARSDQGMRDSGAPTGKRSAPCTETTSRTGRKPAQQREVHEAVDRVVHVHDLHLLRGEQGGEAMERRHQTPAGTPSRSGSDARG